MSKKDMSFFDMSKKICLFNFRHVLFPPRTGPHSSAGSFLYKRHSYLKWQICFKRVSPPRTSRSHCCPIWILRMSVLLLNNNQISSRLRFTHAFSTFLQIIFHNQGTILHFIKAIFQKLTVGKLKKIKGFRYTYTR